MLLLDFPSLQVTPPLIHQWQDDYATYKDVLTNEQSDLHFLVYLAFSGAATVSMRSFTNSAKQDRDLPPERNVDCCLISAAPTSKIFNFVRQGYTRFHWLFYRRR